MTVTASSLIAFVGLCLILSLTPGPDTFLVLRFALIRPGAGIAAGLVRRFLPLRGRP
ncbi:hypothetical protein [Arthrobacter sp. efr-133-TYG-104]|uniref:hypothetical protein n=1 Tax=Arthrobacter sp. efr-133-TYG-104 TaxID=3040324 RepID=UPI00254A59D4|nr:hypothetical protein [Arthrobacter sp. efr-133-TYG-104]